MPTFDALLLITSTGNLVGYIVSVEVSIDRVSWPESTKGISFASAMHFEYTRLASLQYHH